MSSSNCLLILDEDDLHCILEHLKTVKSQCYNIGTQFHLEQDELKSIMRDTADRTEAMTAIVNCWLKLNYDYKRYGKPTWKHVVEAVASPNGGNNNALAMKIAKSHSG